MSSADTGISTALELLVDDLDHLGQAMDHADCQPYRTELASPSLQPVGLLRRQPLCCPYTVVEDAGLDRVAACDLRHGGGQLAAT